jgi:hypothetical protein
MPIEVQFSGDPSEKNEMVERLLREHYQEKLGAYHAEVAYIAGRGHHVVAAVSQQMRAGAYAPGDQFESSRFEDVSAEVSEVLRAAGWQVW